MDRRGSGVRLGSGLVHLLGAGGVAVVIAGCAAADGDSAPGGSLDARVVDAVARTSGDSVDNARWMETQLFRLRTSGIRSCLEEAGRPDLFRATEDEFETRLAVRSHDFPDPDELLEQGLTPFAAASAEDQIPESDAVIVMRCGDVPPKGDAADAEALYRNLMGLWQQQVDATYAGKEMEAPAVSFSVCLRRKGVPEADSRTEDAFLGWAERQSQTNPSDPAGRAAAAIYVECGRGLFAARSSALEEQRGGFIDANRDEIGLS